MGLIYIYHLWMTLLLSWRRMFFLKANDVMHLEPLSPNTLRRVREQNALIANEGSERHDLGPNFGVSASSQASHKGGSPGEINYAPTTTVAFPAQGTAQTKAVSNNISLENLHDNFTVQKGVLSLVNVDISANMEKGEPSNVAQNQKIITWSDMVRKNTEMPKSKSKVSWSYNDDGSINLIPPRKFLLEAHKKWDSSCIGHFVGGSFDFKFVKDRALSMWRHCGLQNVYYNSKGYFTFRFGKIEEVEGNLSLNSVQIGGRTLYLKPCMESCEFKRNVIDKVSCWIMLGEVPPTYWSHNGLVMIAEIIG